MERQTNDYEHIRPKLHRNLLTMIDRGLLVYNRASHTWYVWNESLYWQTNGNSKAISDEDIYIMFGTDERYYLKDIKEIYINSTQLRYMTLRLSNDTAINLNFLWYQEYQFESLLKTAISQILSKVEIDKLNLFENVEIGGEKVFRLMSIEDKKLLRSLGTLLCPEDSDSSEAEDNFMYETQPIDKPVIGGDLEGVEIGGFVSNQKEEIDSDAKKVIERLGERYKNPFPKEKKKKTELTCSEISKVVNSWKNAYSWSSYDTNGYHYISTPSQVSISLNSPTTASLSSNVSIPLNMGSTEILPYTRYNSDLINGYLSSKVVGATIHNTKGDRYTFVSIGDDRVLEFLIYVGLVNEVKLFQGSEKIYATLKSNVMIGLTVLESAGVSEVNLTDRTITFTYDSTGDDSYRQAVYGFDDFMDRVLKGDIYVRNFDMSEGRKLYIVKFC